MITKLPYKKKSTLKKKLPCFVFYHTFSPFWPHLTTPNPHPSPFLSQTVLYQGIRIAAHIHNPRPFKIEIYPPVSGVSEIVLQASNVLLVDCPRLFLDDGGDGLFFVGGHRGKKSAASLVENHQNFGKRKFENMKNVKEKHDHPDKWMNVCIRSCIFSRKLSLS